MVDVRQVSQYADYLSKIGWITEQINETNYFIKKFPIIGSVIKIQRPEEIKINKIKELAKKYHAFQIIIEPKTDLDAKYLQSFGFHSSKSPYLPTKTLQLDLTESETELFKKLKKDAKHALKKFDTSLAVEQVGADEFRNDWKKTAGWKRYVPPLNHLQALKKSFKKNCIFLLEKNGLGGAIFLVGDKIAYYWQAFTNEEGRKKLVQYKVVWEGVLWAKKHGSKIFDFEGIYDERFPNKSWLGFSHFKKSFGGYELDYPGAFVKSKFPFV